MPIKPKIVTLTNASVDILNAIRNNSSINYRNYVPVATSDAESIKTIGAVLMDSPNLQNEFINALIGRIGRVYVNSRMYENPLAFAKKGTLAFGETVEEIFVDIANVEQYDMDNAEETVFKINRPDIKSAFHVLNFKKLYPVTISERELATAFLSYEGVTDLIGRIVDSLYNGASYDEYQVTMYMLARQILNGRLHPVTVSAPVDEDTAKMCVTSIKGESNAFTFLNARRNIAGVRTSTRKDDQYLLVSSSFDALVDVNVLASAFNMDKATFMGRRVVVDGFGSLDTARLAKIFDGDSTYEEVSQDELDALNAIPAVLVDRDFFMIFDNGDPTMRDNYNGKGEYWNYFYHTWKTFSISPFAQASVFVPATPSVLSITASPSAITIAKGQSASVAVNVTTENFAPQTVNYSSNTAGVDVSPAGLITVAEDVAASSATITITSTYDADVDTSVTVTITE